MTFDEWWPLYCALPEHLRGRNTVDAARSAWLAAQQVERDACAKVCEDHAAAAWDHEAGALNCAAQIRERHKQPLTPP